MIANARHVGNPPQASAEPREIPAFRVLLALNHTPVLASLTRHRSKAESCRTKRLSPGARLLIMRLASRFSHYVTDPKAPAFLVGLTEKDRQNRAGRWTAWETQRHTANGLGVDERTVRRYLVEAIDSGIVSVESRTTSAGDGTKPHTTNRYRIHLPARWFIEKTQTDGTTKTAVYLTPPAPRRKRAKSAAAAPDYDEADAPERTDMSAPDRTEMSANTGSGEQGNISLSGVCRTPPRAAASAVRMPTQADPEADPDADAAAAIWRRPTPDAHAGDAGTPVGATAHNGGPDGPPGLAGGREALRAPCDPYVHPRLASIPENLRSRVSRLQRQQTANVGRGYVRGIAHDIERESTHAAIEHGRKYRSANG